MDNEQALVEIASLWRIDKATGVWWMLPVGAAPPIAPLRIVSVTSASPKPSTPPKPARAKRKPNRWIEYVHDAWWMARLDWEAQIPENIDGRESDMKLYRRDNPPPLYRDFLKSMRLSDDTELLGSV